MNGKTVKLLAYLTLILVLLQFVLVLMSWIMAAAVPMSSIRSLLGSEGIRWFFGNFGENLSTPILLDIVLFGIAYGAFRTCGLLTLIKEHRFSSYRQRFAVQMVVLVLIAVLVIMFLLTAVPHAILLSATGDLFPSSFSDSIIPVLMATLCLVSMTYGVASGTYRTLVGVYRGVTASFPAFLPLLLLYVLVVELYYSFCFVFLG